MENNQKLVVPNGGMLIIKVGSVSKTGFWKDTSIENSLSGISSKFVRILMLILSDWTEQRWDVVFRRFLHDREVEGVAELPGKLGGMGIDKIPQTGCYGSVLN